jgi:hypothetical protein
MSEPNTRDSPEIPDASESAKSNSTRDTDLSLYPVSMPATPDDSIYASVSVAETETALQSSATVNMDLFIIQTPSILNK